MSETTNLIHEIVDASLEGTSFYEEAAKSVGNGKLCDVFSQMAKAKAEFADNLSTQIKPRKHRSKLPGGLENLSETYADTLERSGHFSASTLTALEQSERAVHDSLMLIVADRDNTCVLRVHVRNHMKQNEEFTTRLRRCVRDMPAG